MDFNASKMILDNVTLASCWLFGYFLICCSLVNRKVYFSIAIDFLECVGSVCRSMYLSQYDDLVIDVCKIALLSKLDL